jgi:hypothetical protein
MRRNNENDGKQTGQCTNSGCKHRSAARAVAQIKGYCDHCGQHHQHPAKGNQRSDCNAITAPLSEDVRAIQDLAACYPDTGSWTKVANNRADQDDHSSNYDSSYRKIHVPVILRAHHKCALANSRALVRYSTRERKAPHLKTLHQSGRTID